MSNAGNPRGRGRPDYTDEPSSSSGGIIFLRNVTFSDNSSDYFDFNLIFMNLRNVLQRNANVMKTITKRTSDPHPTNVVSHCCNSESF